VRLGPPPSKVAATQFAAVKLPYDTSVASVRQQPSSGCFDCIFDHPTAPQGKAIAAEMLPAKIDYAGLRFDLAPANESKPNAVAADGQTIDLPTGNFNRLYLLAAAADGDQAGRFKVGAANAELTVEDWTGFVGQWDDRVWKTAEEPDPDRPGATGSDGRPLTVTNEYAEMVGIRPGFIKRADIAWFASHRHDAGAADEPYAYSYLFAYAVDVPAGAKTLTLPHKPNIRILAATVANEKTQTWPAQPLYDVLEPGNKQPRR
jgi:alpha-mannosidase